MNKLWKNGLHAESTILWARTDKPSHASVTSTKCSDDKSWSNIDNIFDWWLFHFRQNCCVLPMFGLKGGKCVRYTDDFRWFSDICGNMVRVTSFMGKRCELAKRVTARRLQINQVNSIHTKGRECLFDLRRIVENAIPQTLTQQRHRFQPKSNGQNFYSKRIQYRCYCISQQARSQYRWERERGEFIMNQHGPIRQRMAKSSCCVRRDDAPTHHTTLFASTRGPQAVRPLGYRQTL